MMEMKRNGNRILVVLVMLLMVWSVNPVASHAALDSGKSGRAVFEYLGKSKDGKYYYDKVDNEQLPKFMVKIGGVKYIGYCMNNGRIFYHNRSYTSKKCSSARDWKDLSAAQKRTLSLIMIYGYNKGKSAPYGYGIDYYAATQALVWEATEGKESVSVSGAWTSKANAHDDMIAGRVYGEKNYKWIKQKITAHLKGASFTKQSASAAKTYTMKYNYRTKTFSTTLTDTNGGNTYKKSKFTSGLSMSRTSHKYTFSAAAAGTYSAVLQNRITIGTNQPLLILQPSSRKEQSLIFGATDDIKHYVKLKTEGTGKAQIKKTSDNGIVSGFTFNVKCSANGYNANHTTDSAGNIALKLYPGTYTVTEILTDEQKKAGYVPPAAAKVKVMEGKTATVKMHNKYQPNKFGLKIVKTTTDGGSVEGFRFKIKGDCGEHQYEGEGVTDANGYIVKEDLDPGIYTVTEVMTDEQKLRYHEPQSQTVSIVDNGETGTVCFENKDKQTPITIKKTCVDGNIAGIEFTVTGKTVWSEDIEPIVKTTTEDGRLDLNLQPGTYTIEETGLDPLRYVHQEPQTITITGDETQVIEVNFENIPIIPEINTKAYDRENGTQVSAADGSVELIDTVEYRDVVAGERYLLQASLVKKDGTPVCDKDGNAVTAELEIMPQESSGTVDVTLPAFDGSELADQQVVIFENLYLCETRQLLVEHSDLENQHQTITLIKEETPVPIPDEPVPEKEEVQPVLEKEEVQPELGKAEVQPAVTEKVAETGDSDRTTMYLCIIMMVTAIITALCCMALRHDA